MSKVFNMVGGGGTGGGAQLAAVLNEDGTQNLLITDDGTVFDLPSLTADADATPEDVAAGKVFYAKGMRMVGAGPSNLLGDLTEGSLVSILEDGKLTPFYVAKHNYEADLNGEGRTLLVRKNGTIKGRWDAEGWNAYATSDIDSWMNSDYKNLLSSTVKAQIGGTSFEYTVGGGDATVSVLVRAIFALSATELGLSDAYANTEGSVLPIASTLRVATLDSGVAEGYWMRTPEKNSNSNAFYAAPNTGSLLVASASGDTAYRPCFTLPATMALRDEPFTDGSWMLADEDILFDTETASITAKAGVNYTNGIADLDASTLHDIASAISANPNITKDHSIVYYDNGYVRRKISVGDTQNIDINGVSYAVNIIGFNHDDLVSGTAYGNPTATGKAGMSFQLVNCIERVEMIHYATTNAVGWASCNMRVSYVPTYLGQLSAALNSVLKQVKKLTSAGNRSTTIVTTEDKLFLLSEIEIFGAITFSFAGEGSQYAYYKAGNSTVKKLSGSVKDWWERSPRNDNTTGFCEVSPYGTATADTATANFGVAFAYCI